MTTPSPDPQVEKSETLEVIAESIARRGLPFSAFTNAVEYKSALNFVTREVLSALRNERERSAKVAEAKAREYRTESVKAEASASAFPNLWTPRARAADAIAAAIREGR